jgi:hypothetical protein
MDFLGITNQLIAYCTIIHLPDHYLQLGDASLIDFAKIIDEFDEIVSSKSSHGGCVFGLDDSTIVDAIVAEEGAIGEVQSVRYPDPASSYSYVISF